MGYMEWGRGLVQVFLKRTGGAFFSITPLSFIICASTKWILSLAIDILMNDNPDAVCKYPNYKFPAIHINPSLDCSAKRHQTLSPVDFSVARNTPARLSA